MTSERLCQVLNELIATCKDGEQGFLACAERLQAPELRTLFITRAEEFERFAGDLQLLVEDQGGQPDTAGTPAGALHRRWVGMRALLTEHPDLAMLEECERGLDFAVKRYRQALDRDLPAPVRQLIEHELAGTLSNHDLVKGLRDRRTHATA